MDVDIYVQRPVLLHQGRMKIILIDVLVVGTPVPYNYQACSNQITVLSMYTMVYASGTHALYHVIATWEESYDSPVQAQSALV